LWKKGSHNRYKKKLLVDEVNEMERELMDPKRVRGLAEVN
jgi:hypothetical protein